MDPIWPITSSAWAAFRIHGKTASIVFSIKHEKFGVQLIGDQFLLLLLQLFLVFKYTLLNFLLLRLFILAHENQFRIIRKIKGFVYVFQQILGVLLLFLLSGFFHDFPLVLIVLGRKNILRIQFLIFRLSWPTIVGF